MPGADVIPLTGRDSALEEESRTAARLVAEIRAGKESAKTELVERYSAGLFRILKQRVGDEESARDCLQDTLYIALKKLAEAELEEPERLAGYLRGIAVRVAFGAARQRRKDPVPVDDQVISAAADCAPSQFDSVSQKETREAVLTLLDSMPVARDRELLIRLYVYDQDRDEICRELQLERLHFNRVLHRAKGRFREILGKSGMHRELTPP